MIYEKPLTVKLSPGQAKAIRLKARFTQKDLAFWLGVSRETVLRRECGSLPITRETEQALRFLLISECGEYKLPAEPVRRTNSSIAQSKKSSSFLAPRRGSRASTSTKV